MTAQRRRVSVTPPSATLTRNSALALARRRWWWLALAAIAFAGTLARVWMLWRANWLLDGDEATMALVGQHIQTQGERPIFFPGQAYMGAWYSYLNAGLFALFGMSRPVAKLPPLFGSLAFIVTLALLARRLYGPRTALLAAAFAALPSLYLLSATLRLSYPLIDVMAIGNVVLLIAVANAYRTTPPADFARRSLVLGLLTGFAFWLHAAIVVYALPAGLLLLLRWPWRALFPGAPLALLGFVVGAAPVFQQARSDDYTLFDYLRGNASDRKGYDILAIGKHLVETILPRILGVAVPWQATPDLVQLAIGLPSIAAIGLLIWRCRRAPLDWLRARPAASEPEFIVLVFGATVLTTYLTSRFSVYALTFPTIDTTGRYVAPLGTFLPLAFAGAARQLTLIGRFGRFAAVAGAALVLAGTGYAYLASQPNAVFQSPYYRTLPASNTELIVALDELNIDAVWIDHWAGKPLMFDTQERVAAADYVDLRVYGGIDRLAAATNRVFADPDPAFVFVTNAGRVPLEDALDRRGIRYISRRAGEYLIVKPNQRVDPASVVDALTASPTP